MSRKRKEGKEREEYGERNENEQEKNREMIEGLKSFDNIL